MLRILLICLLLALPAAPPAQVVTYDVQAPGLIGMQATSPFGDQCFAGDFELITDGSPWGITWTSGNLNPPVSVNVQILYTLEEGFGPYSLTLNGSAEGTSNPPAQACMYHIQSFNLTPANYNPGGVNTFILDYTPGGATPFINLNFGWSSGSFARVTVDYGGPLPLRVTGLRAQPEGKSVALHWQAEPGSGGSFTAERSTDGLHWTPVGQQPRSDVATYRLQDRAPAAGQNLYRLRFTDPDGLDRILGYTQALYLELPLSAEPYPNPCHDKLILPGASRDEVRLLDAQGRMHPVPQILRGEDLELDLSALPEGIYFLYLPGEGYSRRVIRLD